MPPIDLGADQPFLTVTGQRFGANVEDFAGRIGRQEERFVALTAQVFKKQQTFTQQKVRLDETFELFGGDKPIDAGDLLIQRFEFSAAAHLADELLHLGEQVHAPGSDVEADEQPLFAEAAHLALALAEQLTDLRKIEDRIAFELAPVILHEVYDLEDLFDRPQNAGQVIRVLIIHLCRV